MSVYQPFKLEQLQHQLKRLQGDPQIWPLLESENKSLSHQPPANALPAQLGSRAQVILEGPPGSGKTVLALHIGSRPGGLECVYLEAQRWTPTPGTSILDDFLITAGCDHGRAMDALKQGRLALILDAVDEAPWRTGGASALEALPELSEAVRGQAGLLIIVRTARALPLLPGSTIHAALGGIAESDLERFLVAYAGGRGGVGDVVEKLRRNHLPPAIKYSPLILRRFAEGLILNEVPENVVELFERIADFHIERECGKSLVSGALVPGSWQDNYSNPTKHRNLVSALVYSVGKTGRKIAEPDFELLIRNLLQPLNLGAHSLVDISTLMAQHPLVSVAYISDPGGVDSYFVQAAHDWVRAGLFPRFMSELCIEAQLEACETWHEALPHPDDFAVAWSYLRGRSPEVLEQIIALASTPSQHREVGRWLLAQVLNSDIVDNAKGLLFEAVARLAYKFVLPAGNVFDALELGAQGGETLLALKGAELSLERRDENANMAGLEIDSVSATVGVNGPEFLFITACNLRDVKIEVIGSSRLKLDGCVFESGSIKQRGQGVTELVNCAFDPEKVVLPENTLGLETCDEINISRRLHVIATLAAVLKKFVLITDPMRPGLAKRKTNLSKDNVFHGVVGHLDVAETIVDALINLGYLALKPTGGVRRLDPTDKFDAEGGARFILSPVGASHGLMIAEVLRKVYSS